MHVTFANILLVLAALTATVHGAAIAEVDKRCVCHILPSGETICTGGPLCNDR